VDPLVVVQLGADDAQLVMTAASLLEGSPSTEAVPALFASLDRFTALRRETSRDVRMALMERIEELAHADRAEELEPYTRDFDPVVAATASRIVTAWQGSLVSPAPVGLPKSPVPTVPELERLRQTTVVLDMASGHEIRIRLFPGIAPVNAARFDRLATEGYFDGLTFHRIAPNFVVQGGSPGANEYWGDGPFTRDEVGLLGNWRGTVGVSTRGRDTGDAQLYINVVDNLRLDHNYTILGEVVAGMDVVDGLREGAAIARARAIEEARRP
jgi:peptidyl-prolyl cis-trans isomerase B (cyclophilin B)